MIRVLAVFALLTTAFAAASEPLTFDEALVLATRAGAAAAGLDHSLAPLPLRQSPEVRVETAGNAGRALDPFSSDILDTEALTTALTVHYPLWDGGAHRAQVEALEARAAKEHAYLSDARFTTLVEAFGDFYLAQEQEIVLRPLHARLAAEAEKAMRLLEAGELTALEASGRRSLAAAYASQLLEVDIRRGNASARLLELAVDPPATVTLDESPAAPHVAESSEVADDRVRSGSRALAVSRARERAVAASSGFTATLSALAGATTARSEYRDATSTGTSGVYGLRIHLSYPLWRNASVASAEARMAVHESARLQAEASESARQRLASLQRDEDAESRRIALLQQQLEEARLAAGSVERLAQAGLRPASDVAFATAEVERRRLDLLAARVQRWKIVQQLRWLVEPRDRS
jgi:outer membrane protein TolC